jgi:hypothetical protein
LSNPVAWSSTTLSGASQRVAQAIDLTRWIGQQVQVMAYCRLAEGMMAEKMRRWPQPKPELATAAIQAEILVKVVDLATWCEVLS